MNPNDMIERIRTEYGEMPREEIITYIEELRVALRQDTALIEKLEKALQDAHIDV